MVDPGIVRQMEFWLSVMSIRGRSAATASERVVAQIDYFVADVSVVGLKVGNSVRIEEVLRASIALRDALLDPSNSIGDDVVVEAATALMDIGGWRTETPGARTFVDLLNAIYRIAHGVSCGISNADLVALARQWPQLSLAYLAAAPVDESDNGDVFSALANFLDVIDKPGRGDGAPTAEEIVAAKAIVSAIRTARL